MFANVEVLVADSDPTIRQAVRNILFDSHIRHVSMCSTFAKMEAHLVNETPDILIADHRLPGGDIKQFIHSVRHDKTKTTPFLPVIATAWEPTGDDVKGLIETGADHIVSKPLSAKQLMNRIRALATKRKEFVVTSQYIGPDRRTEDDRGSEIETISVPSTLTAKVVGGKNADMGDLKAQIEECTRTVNIQKLDRDAGQVTYLVNLIVPAFKNNEVDENTISLLKALDETSKEISLRMAGTPYEHVSDLCNTLIEVTGRILMTEGSPEPKDILLLTPLSESIRLGFAECDSSAKRMAKAIQNSVSEIH